MAKQIVVLGGGYAGVLTAKHLEKAIRKEKKQHELTVTLIDKNPFHTMLTELHEVAAGRVQEESIQMDFDKIFAKRHVSIVMDNIKTIDFANNHLIGETETHNYDYLVIGSGSQPAFWGVEGAQDHSFTLWSFEDAIKLREQILSKFREAKKTKNVQKRRELLTFVVVGGGFTGVEMMGELAEWVPILCEKHNIDKSEVKLYLMDMIDQLIPSIPEKLGKKAGKRLRKMGVEVLLGAKVLKLTQESIELEQNSQPTTYPTQTVIWTAGIVASDVLKDSDIEKTKGQRLETNEFLQAKGHDNVYVVGDNLYYIPEGDTQSVPQMVENCEASSHCAANNILASAFSKGEKKAYKPSFHGMMVSIGGRYGIAYVGTHTKKFALPSFFAMLSKHFINIIYFMQVLGFNKVYDYLLHEIFRIKNNRSFVGGYFSNASPNFWAVPLRVFLGGMWLLSGLEKLPRIIIDFNQIFLFTLPSADAASSATQEVVETVVEASPMLQFPDFIQPFYEWALGIFLGKPLPVPGFMQGIVDWSMQVFIAPIAPQFQAFMIIAEILVGLLLIGGLFTTAASVASVMLCIMIYMSGWSDITIVWYLLASISFIGIGGTGQVFALDYYVMPFLKKQWKKLGFVKKWYIFTT